ncbi:MAG: pitrilysin family protein, partial [Pseudomonadota bacterium]
MFAREVLNKYTCPILVMPAKAGMMIVSLLLAGVLLFTAVIANATPKIEHWTLKNGARVYFVEAGNLPMVTLNVVFDAGSARDLQGRNGLSMLTNHLLNDGTGELDADAIAATFEGLGAEFGSSNDRDMAGVSLRSLSDRALLDPALDLFTRVLAAPSFPAASFERERQRALLGLKQAEASAGDVAAKAFIAQLYKGHPYALPAEGSEAGLKALTRNDLAAFHARHYVGRNAVLALIGDIKLSEAKAIAERVLGGLPAGEAAPALPRVMDVVPRARAERVLSHPSTQTHILIGEAGMARNDPDYFALYLGNHVLGGSGLVSRLSQEVREQRSLSYSVYSYFMPLREPGPFLLGLQTKNSQRAEALTVVRRVLKEFAEKGPTPEELVAAKKNVTGGFPLRIDSNKKIAEYLTVIGFYGLQLTYIDDFIPRIEAVTAEQIRDAFRRRVHP